MKAPDPRAIRDALYAITFGALAVATLLSVTTLKWPHNAILPVAVFGALIGWVVAASTWRGRD